MIVYIRHQLADSITTSDLIHINEASTLNNQSHDLNSLPNDKFLHKPKFKAFADDKIIVAKLMIYDSGRVENIVGKGENAGHQHFLLFQQCFQKGSYSGKLKVEIVW